MTAGVAHYGGGCTSHISNIGIGVNLDRYAVGCLPEVDFNLPPSWAGQIPISNTTDDELFFWLFEAENGTRSDNLIIWLNGGPGCSSLDGLTKENGPLHFESNSTKPSPNPYSWTKLANVLYIDQPVGSGYSDGSVEASLNAQVTQDFTTWLSAFYGIFPSLKTKQTYIMGESYAGIYIPYFTQALVENNHSFSLDIKAISIGDGTFGNGAALNGAGATSFLLEHNDALEIPQDILDVFELADKHCGFSDVLDQATYPPKGPITIPGNPEGDNFRTRSKRQTVPNGGCIPNPDTPTFINNSIFACNQESPLSSACATFTTGLDYLNNTRSCFNPYNILYNCTTYPTTSPFTAYLNSSSVRAAIHAPNKTYTVCNDTILATMSQEYVVPPAYSIMPALIDKGIKIHVYSGGLDYLLNHQGAELAIQNMTWGGKQGFQGEVERRFLVDGFQVGRWGVERNLSYHHFLHAGHAVPYDQPAAAFAFVRGFVIGDAGYGDRA